MFLKHLPTQDLPSSNSNEIKRDGIYVAYGNGIVKDTKTGLEWKVGPDKDTNWYEARSWVRNLNIEGGGWRLPTKNELEGLHNFGAGRLNMTPLLKTTGRCVWSAVEEETKWVSDAWKFCFDTGEGLMYWKSSGERAFAVRSSDEMEINRTNILPHEVGPRSDG